MKRAFGTHLLALALLGCGSSNDYGDAPAGASRQVSLEVDVCPADPEIIVLVADDRAEAEDLRQLVTLELESFASRSLSIAPECAPDEPTRKHPIDVSLVVAHPSAVAEARFAGPSIDAALRWREPDATPSGRLAWTNAVRSAIDEVHEEMPFSALESMKSVIDLLGGKRAAKTGAESSLLASLPGAARLKVLLLAAHEDESPGEPSGYAVAVNELTRFDSLVFPSAAPVEPVPSCRASSDPSSDRFEAWREAQQLPLPTLWPCNGLRLLQPTSATCVPRCVPWRVLHEDDGRATCRILVDAEVDHCDATFGWLDPEGDDGVRRPVIPTPGNPKLRTCEIQQLTGKAHESCQSSLSCPDCVPGWCATEVPELLDDCARGVPLPLRMVGGADVAALGVATMLCNVERVAD